MRCTFYYCNNIIMVKGHDPQKVMIRSIFYFQICQNCSNSVMRIEVGEKTRYVWGERREYAKTCDRQNSTTISE